MTTGREQAERSIEMMEFLVTHLKRPLTPKEINFISMLVIFGDTSYDQIMAFFKELVEKK